MSRCGADDYNFYEHSTLEEICENLITRALRMFGYEASMKLDRNGFPSIFVFDGVVNEFVERDIIQMYPFFTSRTFNYNKMMNKINSLLTSKDRNNLYFHGTSWENSIAMTEEILRSPRYTDFGRNYFYILQFNGLLIDMIKQLL